MINAAEQGSIAVRAVAHPFQVAGADYALPEGLSIAAMIGLIQPDPLLRRHGHVFVGDDYVRRDDWENRYPAAGERVTIRLTPQGGGGKKSVFSVVLSIAVMAASAGLGAPLGAALFGDLGTIGGFSVSTLLGKAIISGAGYLLQSALAPPARPRINALSKGPANSPTLFIEGARNQLNPFGPVPVIVGKHLRVPDLGAPTYTETIGNDQYVRQLFVWGYAPLDHDTLVNSLKLGTTPITDFTDVEMAHYLDGTLPSSISLYPDEVLEDDLSVELTYAGGPQVHTTHPDCDEIIVDLTWPQGLTKFRHHGTSDDGQTSHFVTYTIAYSPAGAGTWTTASYTETADTTSALRLSYRFPVTRGQYDVQVTKTSADIASNDGVTIFEQFFLTAVRTVTYAPPVLMEGLAFSVVRMKATNQLNGAIDQLNGICQCLIPDWDADSSTWITRATQNPASIMRHVWQGPANKRPLADDRINLAALQDWHAKNKTRGFSYNAVIDFATTVGAMADEVAAAGRAVRVATDGKWSVVIDEAKTSSGQMFTPRNSSGYQGELTYPEIPHAFRVQFINEQKAYVRDERVVYDDGYSKNGEVPGTIAATVFQTMELPGVTNPDQIWVLGREHIAEMRERPETHTIKTDIENLTITRGDPFEFQHDVILVGLGAARVKSIADDGGSPANAISVTVDNDMPMEAGKNYCFRFRLADNTQIVKNVVTVAGQGRTFTFTTPFPLTDAPEPGDLAAFGEAGTETLSLILKSITGGPHLSATLKAVSAGNGIFTASSGAIPPFDSGITVPPSMTRAVAPVIRSIQSDESVAITNIDGSVSVPMVITLDNRNAAPVYPVIMIRQSGASIWRPVTAYQSSATRIVLTGLQSATYYDVQIFYGLTNPESGQAANLFSPPAEQDNVLFIGEGRVADDVEDFAIQLLGDIGMLTWTPVSNIGFRKYQIRFTSATGVGATWNSAQVYADNVTDNRFPSALQAGTFLIKAFAVGGESANAAAASPSSADIAASNLVQTITEDSTFSGSKTNCAVASGVLKLTTVASLTGTYNFNGAVDLGAVYTSRLSASIIASGNNPSNVMANWTSLDSLSSLSGADPSSWSITLQMRTTPDDPAGSPTWSAWQDFMIGSYAFRAAQFRLILNSVDGATNPNVTALSVTIDMPDRFEKQFDMAVGTGGQVVNYSPYFYVNPSLVITANDAQSGDQLILTGPSGTGKPDRTGFKVAWKNSGGTAVTRSTNYIAHGFGKVM